MLFKNITILDENFDVKENQYVLVEGKRISSISDKEPENYKGRIYEGEGKLLMPGFYNAHGHSPMAIMRGYGENLKLNDWLTKKIFPFEDKLSGEAVYWSTLLTMAESMRFGIVSTTDMYYFIDDMVKATVESGMKANISRAIVHFDRSEPKELPSYKEMVRTFYDYHNTHDERIKMDVSIHGEYTSNPLAVSRVVDFGKSVEANMHIHVSETLEEHEDCKQRYKKTPVKYFYDLGAWDMPATAAHCVHIENEDFYMLKEKGVTVASNPISNLKLASGVANVPKMLEMGINVAIGTDSVASNNSLNFIEEMKVFAISSKMYYNNPTVVTPKETIKAATVVGALSQGRKDCGVIKEGNCADLIVIDIDNPYMYPNHNLLNNIVYSASGTDVILTMCDGKVIYENGQYTNLDLERIIYNVEKAKKAILAKL